MVYMVDIGISDLVLDFEIPLDGLLGTDRPLVVLIYRQGNLYGLREVYRRTDCRGDGDLLVVVVCDAVDADVSRIGLLGRIDCNGL